MADLTIEMVFESRVFGSVVTHALAQDSGSESPSAVLEGMIPVRAGLPGFRRYTAGKGNVARDKSVKEGAAISVKGIEVVKVTASGVMLVKGADEPSGPLVQVGMVDLVKRGMAGSYLRRLCEGIPRQLLADTLGTEVSNFSKLYKRTLTKVQTDEINDLTSVWAELRAFFDGDEELLTDWLNTPLPALSGQRPIDLLSTIVGRRALRERLNAMQYGEFA